MGRRERAERQLYHRGVLKKVAERSDRTKRPGEEGKKVTENKRKSERE